MSSAIVKVPPADIQWKLSLDLLSARDNHESLESLTRQPLAHTDKHRSIVQRYVGKVQWEDTPLFQRIYKQRLSNGDSIRGCKDWGALIAHYHDRVDAMFEDLRTRGFQPVIDGHATTYIPVYITADNAVVIGNQGNHRLAMAQIIGLDHVLCEVVAKHPASTRTFEGADPDLPVLPACASAIPAMTTEAERRCYYRLTREQASKGAVVELGAWLGAASAYIAAGMRDAGVERKAQVYDRFIWKPSSHDAKAGGALETTQLKAFTKNMGPLTAYVDVHAQELRVLTWKGGPVSLLVCDAPKRIPEIAHVLQVFSAAMTTGSLMAWQDFAYFPSYDIPAALIRMGDRVSFVEAVYPGTTAVFKVVKPWKAEDVSVSALSLQRWTPDEVEAAWKTWGARLPEPMRPRFACGAAMFLCDLNAVDRAKQHLRAVIDAHGDAVLPKWRYLLDQRAALMKRYRPLVEVLACA